MKKLILISLVGFITVSVLSTPSLSAPYRPPSSGSEGENDGGSRDRDENKDRNKDNNGKTERDEPTPTPCLPNLCWFGETPCCISPMCVLLGTTTADTPGYNRCPEAGKEVRLGRSIVTLPDTLRTAYRFISEIAKSLFLQTADYSKARDW